LTPDWYPQKLGQRISWHANLSEQATATGTNYGLSVAEVAQIVEDALAVRTIIVALQQAEAFVQAMTQYKKLVLEGKPGTVLPPPPTPPAAVVLGGGAMAAIMARTRLYVARIKGSAGYSKEIGELYGIVAPERAEPRAPEMTARALTGSKVRLRVIKRGFRVAAIDSRRGGGVWEQIGIAQIAEFIDERPPLAEGQPEIREYRAQGMRRNRRVGDLSAGVEVVTAP